MQGDAHAKSQAQSSKEVVSTFHTQLAAQIDPESASNAVQGPADPSETPDLVSGTKANTNPITPFLQSKSAPGGESAPQIVAMVAGKSAIPPSPAMISPTPLPRTAGGTQPAQKAAPRNAQQAQSVDELSRSDSAAELNCTTPIDLTSITSLNAFANVLAPTADDPSPSKAASGIDKSVKSAAIKSGTPADLSVSQPQNAPKTDQTDFAFAVRVSTDKAPNPSPQESGDSVSLRLASGERGAAPSQNTRDISKGGTIREAEFPQSEIPREAISSMQGRKTAEPQTMGSTAKTDSETPALTADTVKILNVRMNADGEQHVAIRVIERSGEISVSVRSADPALTRTLQDRMPELTNRLQDQQLQADTWVPRSSESASSRDEGFQSPQDQPQQYDTGGNRGRRQQRQPRPEWVQELESIAPNSRV